MATLKERLNKLRKNGDTPFLTSNSQKPLQQRLNEWRKRGNESVVLTPEQVRQRNEIQFSQKIYPSVTPWMKKPSNAAELSALTNPMKNREEKLALYDQWKESRRQEVEERNQRKTYGNFDLTMGQRALSSLEKQAQTLLEKESLPYDTAEEWTELHNQRMDTQKKVSDLSEFLSEAEQYQNQSHWESIPNNPDFQEKSQYLSTQKNVPQYDPIAKVSYPTSFDDILYDYINKNEEAINQMTISSIADNTAFLGLNKSYLQQMSEDEIATFNYLYATEGKEPAYQYVKNITEDLNARKRESVEQQWAENARENPVLYSVFSIASSPLKSLSFLGQVADYASDQKLDQNEGYNKFSYINSAVRDEVNEIVQNKWGPVGSFAYQTGMSMGDFLFNNLITGGNRALSLAIMGSGAAADTTISAKDRGLSDKQAFTLGVIAGAAEIITEKVSIDALFDTIKLGKEPLNYFLKNAFSEGGEEVGSDIINLIADILVAKDQSEWQMSINSYQEEEGMSERNAFWHALLDQAKTMGVDFLGGAVSGAAISGSAIGLNELGNRNTAYKTGRNIQKMGDDVVRSVVEQGLQSDKTTKSYEMANRLQGKLDSGKTIKNSEIGRLYQENVSAIEQEIKSGKKGGIPESTREIVQKVLDGEEISGNQANAIIQNQEALETLEKATGKEIDVQRPLSEVKQSILEIVKGRKELQKASSSGRNKIMVPENLARSFGENGAKAFTASYESDVNLEEYYAGFSAYYQAGISGADMKKVDTDYSGRLNPAQKFAAYSSGKNDAELSLKREQAAAKYAKISGTDSGLVYDDFVRQAIESGRTVTDVNGETRTYLTSETAEKINSLAKSLGVRVQFVDSVRGGTANAQISGSTILVEKNNPNPVMAIIGHEMTHRMQELAPAEYRKFRDAIAQEEQDRIQERMDSYASYEVALTQEQAMDEVAADYAGRMIDDGKFLDDFIEKHRQDKTLLQRIRDAIHAIVEKLTGAEKKKAQTAEGKLTAALEAAEKRAHMLTEQDQRVEFSDVSTRYSLRKKNPPEKTGVAYKVFYAKNGQLYPPMVANPGGAGTPVGVWLDADVGQAAPPSKTGRAQVQSGGKGTSTSKGILSFRPGWHLGEIPIAKQFARKNPDTGIKDLFPDDFVWAECEYAMDVDYQDEAMSYGYTSNGKFRHSYAGLPKIPTDGYYIYRTNPNPDTVPWIITGAMRVKRILTDKETDSICHNAGIEPMKRQGGPMDEDRLNRLGLKAGDVTNNKKFSMKSPVEETKTLLAIHNLTESKLLSALKLGGLPMPSIAVTRTDIPHTNFGEISLVMNKSAIDPKSDRKNVVYSADAWTPTFPDIEYAVDSAVENRIANRINRLSNQIDEIFQKDLYRISYNIEDLLNRNGGENGLIEQAMENYGLKAAYLEEQGNHISAITTDREKNREYIPEREEKYLAISGVLGTSDPDAIGNIPLKKLVDEYGNELEKVFPGVTKSVLRLSSIIHQVQAYLKGKDNGPVYETVTDVSATKRALDNFLDQDGYEKWVRDLFSGIQADSGIYNNKDKFTPSGNRRTFSQLHYPVTLDNIVKVMKAQNGGNTKNAFGFHGVKSLRAGLAERFKSVADIHRLEWRLQNLSESEQNEILNSFDNRLVEIIDEISDKSPIGETSYSYSTSDIIGNILLEIADSRNYTIDSIMQKFNKEYGYNIGNVMAGKVRDFLFDVSQMPVNIFEAKPERAIGFDEVLAAIIPDNSSKNLTDSLKNAGIRTVEYKSDDETDRLEKINSIEDSRFSLKAGTENKNMAYLQEENRLLREQMKDYISLQKQNTRLQESRDYWKGQTRRTRRVTTDKKAVANAARALIKNYGADIASTEIQEDLQNLYDYIASGYDGKNELTYSEARRRAEEIGKVLVENAVETDRDMYDSYENLRKYLRDTKIIYGPEYHGEIPDWNEFRKRQFGRMNLSGNGATNIDQVYQELSESWPEFFDENSESNPTDQLLRIAEVLDSIYKIEEYNPFSSEIRQAVVGAANEIMELFFELPQTKKTFADVQALKLDSVKAKSVQQQKAIREQYASKLSDLREQNREKIQKVIAKERESRARQIQSLKERYAEKGAANRQKRYDRELRGKITRHAKSLSQKLLNPNDKQHVPDDIRYVAANVLASINQESQYSINAEGKRVKNDSGTPTKRTEAFRALKEQYMKIIAEGGDIVIDPSLLGNEAEGIQGSIDAVMAMGEIKLADMDTEQLETVWRVVKAVERSVSTYGKILSRAKFAETEEWANAIQRDTASRKRKGILTKNHVALDLENPYTFFSHYGESGKAIYRMLRNAQDQQQIMVDTIKDEAVNIVDSKTVKSLEETTKTLTTENGEKLVLSVSQIMELYELTKRNQAKGHLLIGGIVQPEIKSSKIKRGTDIIHLTEGDLSKIADMLTENQKKIADGLQGLTTGILADYGNQASMQAYGYRKFTEKDYWPIRSAKEGLHSNIEKGGNNTRSIKNIGMAKNTVPNAGNPLDIPGIFQTFSDHASDMIDYAAWLCPMEDANRLFNFKFRDDSGNIKKTMKGILDDIGGPGSQKYWHNLMEDIQNGINAPGDSAIWDAVGKTIGSFKGAAVGGNIRVVIQQPTAFFRALAVLDPQDMSRGLAKGVTKGNGWKKALKYSPIAMRKNSGGFDISSPYQMRETLFNTKTRIQKFNDLFSKPAAMADALTWGKLWNACEWATAREHPGLSKGSEAFYRKTAEFFAEVIDQTQVVDGVLQRSNIMRSSNAVVKQATSFMGEPIMGLNLFMRAYDAVRYEQNPQKRRNAIRKLGRSASALLLTNVINALAQSVVDAMRDDDADKEYHEKLLESFTGITGEEETFQDYFTNILLSGNVGSNLNPIGQVPFAKDILSMIQGYNVSRTDMEIFSDIVSASQLLIRSTSGEGQKTTAYALKSLFSASAKLFGIPAANLERDIWAAIRTAAFQTGNIPLQYEMEKAIYSIRNTRNKSRFYDILYRALEQGDMETYQYIRDEMMSHMGTDGESIDSALRSRYKKALEENPNYILPENARDLIGSRDHLSEEEAVDKFGPDNLDSSSYQRFSKQRAEDYRSMVDSLAFSSIYRNMDNQTKDKVIDAAYSLAEETALEDHSGGQYKIDTKWMTLADDAEMVGIADWEYVLFHVVFTEMESTKDEEGNTVKGEAKIDHVREWLDNYSGLTDEQKEFLWGTVYKSKW